MKNSEKAVSKQIRSFLPTTLKPVKPLHFRGQGAKYIGETEPTWPSITDQMKWNRTELDKHMGAALNWYSQTQDEKEVINLGISALSLSGHFPELLVALKNSTLPFSLTVAKLLRMAHNGMYLRFRERRFIVKYIKKCLENKNQKQVSLIETDAPAKPNIQDHLNSRVRKVRGEIDGQFDDFIMTDYGYKNPSTQKKSQSVILDILNNPETSIPVTRSKDLIDYCQQFLDEYKAVYAEKMPFVEAYKNVGKRRIKAAMEWWEQAIVDINVFSHQKQSARKTRVRKPKPPAKIVAKLKFLREFKELKLTSIEPTQILKCSELWTYNVRLRKLGHYVSLNGMPFEVKSTRLINLDPTKSVQKTLRKPAQQLKEFSNYGKPGAIKWFNGIKAVATPLREAINGDSILLRGVK